jgi:hypothetical protein
MISWIQDHLAASAIIGLLAVIAALLSAILTAIRSVAFDLGRLRTDLEVLQGSVESIDMRGNRAYPERHDYGGLES